MSANSNSQRLASIIKQKNSAYSFQGLPDEAAVNGITEGKNIVYVADKKEGESYACKIFDETGNASVLFYVGEKQYKEIQAKALAVLAKILKERRPLEGKDDYSFKIVDEALGAACTDKSTVKHFISTRRLVETVIGQLSERFHIEKVCARDTWHLTCRVARKILAHTLAIFINQ